MKRTVCGARVRISSRAAAERDTTIQWGRGTEPPSRCEQGGLEPNNQVLKSGQPFSKLRIVFFCGMSQQHVSVLNLNFLGDQY